MRPLRMTKFCSARGCGLLAQGRRLSAFRAVPYAAGWRARKAGSFRQQVFASSCTRFMATGHNELYCIHPTI